MRVRRVIPPVLVAVAATVLLTACPGPVPTPTPSSGSPTASPTSTAGTTQLPAEVAFVVTGTFESPTGVGTVEVTMTVDAPTRADASAPTTRTATSVCTYGWC